MSIYKSVRADADDNEFGCDIGNLDKVRCVRGKASHIDLGTRPYNPFFQTLQPILCTYHAPLDKSRSETSRIQWFLS